MHCFKDFPFLRQAFLFTESISGVCLIPALMAVVIGHWAQDGQLHRDSPCSEGHHNVFVFESHEDLMKDLIALFTFEGQLLLMD